VEKQLLDCNATIVAEALSNEQGRYNVLLAEKQLLERNTAEALNNTRVQYDLLMVT
jgi:hypothetical protein